MKIVESKVLIEKLPGEDVHKQIDTISFEVQEAIRKMVHPVNSTKFVINPTPINKSDGKKDYHQNGVYYLKYAFAKNILHSKDWYAEDPGFLPNALYNEICESKSLLQTQVLRHKKNTAHNNIKQTRLIPLSDERENLIEQANKKGWGKIDFLRKITVNNVNFTFVVEWDTGNVSSSHRAINKIISALYFSNTIGGIIIVPMKAFAKFLTDRVSNYEEIVPYFPFWALQEWHNRFNYGYLEVVGILHEDEDRAVKYLPKGKDGNAFRSTDLL